MIRIRAVSAVVAVATSIGLMLAAAPAAFAQDATDAASATAGAATAKQIKKAQRKAAHKAARAKRNEELRTLEKNGYKPTADENNYPDDVQKAERKAAAAQGAAPAAQ
ncbi:hypothetical protein ACV229_21215 [Burkholderia sp. MR1-5-21]